MSRLAQIQPQNEPPDLTEINLTRLLNSLENSIMSSVNNRKVRTLRRSSLERTKASANVEHARTLLFRLEHNTPPPATSQSQMQTHKQTIQTLRRRIKALQHRLDELARPPSPTSSPIPYDEDTSSDSEGGSDILARYAPAIPASDAVEVTPQAESNDGPSRAEIAAAGANVAMTMRRRGEREQQQSQRDRGAASASSVNPSAAKDRLGDITPFSPAPSKNEDTSTAQLLQQHDTEQANLTDSLLTLASALKGSTNAFAEALGGSDEIVEGTARALERNVEGMGRAGERMGLLRRMSEGRGWFGRLGLWGVVGGLWLLVLVVVGVLPKFRL